MSTANGYLTIAGIDVDVVYKDIKNMHISVYPPIGRVRVAAPNRLDEDAIRLAVVQRLAWINRQRQQLQSALRQSEREMIDGESHYVWGQRLRLELKETEGRPHVSVAGLKLRIATAADSETTSRRRILDAWYRRELKAAIPPLVDKWGPIIGRDAKGWAVRRMKTKWGSCNPESGRLWFNVELAKKHPRCLEYIVVHEMTHFLEPTHSDRFSELMNRHLPNWRAIRDDLNGAPLAEEEWGTAR